MTNTWQRWSGIMKCVPFEEKRLAKWNPPYIVQPKYDGDRCRNEPAQNTSMLLTSEENVFFSVPHINEQLDKSGMYVHPWDGELYNHELFLEGGHELIHSICSRTVNIHPRHKEMEFWIFDVKVKNCSQVERMNFIFSPTGLPKNIKIAPYWICETLDDIKKIYDKLIEQKYEGIIVRHLYNIYEDKRSTYMMKFKPKKEDTYEIVGWKEEHTIEGMPKGRIGSIIFSSQKGDKFAVSAGLNDNDREILWDIKDQLAGKMGVVHYQHLTNKQIPKGTFDIEVLL